MKYSAYNIITDSTLKKLIQIFTAAVIFCSAVYADSGSELIYAVMDGDLSSVKSLIASGADVNIYNMNGWTTLEMSGNYS